MKPSRTHSGKLPSPALRGLLEVADGLKFPLHRILHLLDAKGQHELHLPAGFPFAISLFHLREAEITQRLTWHQRLELLIPLDGVLRERMGATFVDLQAGDVLVVDQLKPHQVVNTAGLNTRAIVISFLPEFVFSAGAPPTDYAFLIPFHRKIEGSPHVLRVDSPLAGEAHDAIARLLGCYFDTGDPYRESGCKAWLLVLLNTLIREFRGSSLQRVELLQRQKAAGQLKPVFDHVQEHYASRVTLTSAARMCGMGPGTFSRVFKKITGLTLSGYLNQVRMTHAVELLEETRNTISEIAFLLGFSDQSHFDRRFRRTFGRTPSGHRARLIARD